MRVPGSCQRRRCGWRQGEGQQLPGAVVGSFSGGANLGGGVAEAFV